MRFESAALLLNQAMASSVSSPVVDLRTILDVSLQFTVTSAAAPTGTVAILFSNDGINFGSDPNVTPPTVTANGTKMLNMVELGHQYMKVTYTAGTGTGILNVFGGGKGA